MLSAQAQHLYALKVVVNILPRKGLTSESYVPPINKVLITIYANKHYLYCYTWPFFVGLELLWKPS